MFLFFLRSPKVRLSVVHNDELLFRNRFSSRLHEEVQLYLDLGSHHACGG